MKTVNGARLARKHTARLGLHFPLTPEDFSRALERDAWVRGSPCFIILKPDPMPERGVVYGMCTPTGITYIIHYRNDGSVAQQRCIQFHELGHIALGHVSTTELAHQEVPVMREIVVDSDQEAEAEAFALAMTKFSLLGDPDTDTGEAASIRDGSSNSDSSRRVRARIAAFRRNLHL